MKIKSLNSKAGFTLLEILLVVGIISILAGIVILAINPTKQLGDTRNAQRRSDVLTILNAIYQYSLDNNGSVADLSLDSSGDDCYDEGTDASSTSAMYDELVGVNADYLVGLPHDPSETDDSVSGYNVLKLSNGRITVCAPYSIGEGSITATSSMISVTR
jgi:type IV pilus assembly protein PilA